MAYIAYASAWIATGVAVGIAIYITKDASPLWAMLIPSLVSITSGNGKKEDKE